MNLNRVAVVGAVAVALALIWTLIFGAVISMSVLTTNRAEILVGNLQ